MDYNQASEDARRFQNIAIARDQYQARSHDDAYEVSSRYNIDITPSAEDDTDLVMVDLSYADGGYIGSDVVYGMEEARSLVSRWRVALGITEMAEGLFAQLNGGF